MAFDVLIPGLHSEISCNVTCASEEALFAETKKDRRDVKPQLVFVTIPYAVHNSDELVMLLSDFGTYGPANDFAPRARR